MVLMLVKVIEQSEENAMFAVTGITGKVGGAVARSLLDAGLRFAS